MSLQHTVDVLWDSETSFFLFSVPHAGCVQIFCVYTISITHLIRGVHLLPSKPMAEFPLTSVKAGLDPAVCQLIN